MYYTALQAARLIRAGVGRGTCVGIQRWGFHLGSVLSGGPGLSLQSLNWRWGESTEEITALSIWEPPRALCPSESKLISTWCSLKPEAKHNDLGVVCKLLVSSLYQSPLLPPPRFGVGFSAECRL